MKRKYIKPRSPNRPTTEDLSLRHEYRNMNPFDEIAHLFERKNRRMVFIPGTSPNSVGTTINKIASAHEVHHILSSIGGTPRWDRVPNLIHLSNASHAFVERYPKDGLCMCLWAKFNKFDQKNFPERDFDLEIIGVLSRVSWPTYLETFKCQFTFAEKCRILLLEALT